MATCGAAFGNRHVVVEGNWRSWAVFNADVERRYRYVLGRFWDDDPGSPVLVVGMCNPSKADAFEPDPTITRVIHRAERLKCRGVLVVNAGAAIATDPGDLRGMADPIGPHNDFAIDWAFTVAPMAIRVVAWGRMAQGTRRVLSESMVRMQSRGAVWCWGKTKGGEPRHPLMLAYDTPLVHIVDGRTFP